MQKQAVKFEAIEERIVHNEIKTDEKLNKNEQKRRGRKREKDELYFLKAQERINNLKEQLKTAKEDGLNVKDR